jgi:hypothetical protein
MNIMMKKAVFPANQKKDGMKSRYGRGCQPPKIQGHDQRGDHDHR